MLNISVQPEAQAQYLTEAEIYICLKTRVKGNSSKAGTQRQSEPRMSQISRRLSDRPCQGIFSIGDHIMQ